MTYSVQCRRNLHRNLRSHGKVLAILLVFVCAGAAAGCSRHWPSEPTHEPFPADTANPATDARFYISMGDDSLRSVRGYTDEVPGVNSDYLSLSKKFNIVPIPGTSDMFFKGRGDFTGKMTRYAFVFNRAVLRSLGCDPDHPMNTCSRYPEKH